MKTKRPLTLYILFAMLLGIAVGYACHQAFPDKKAAADIAGYISIVTDVFPVSYTHLRAHETDS